MDKQIKEIEFSKLKFAYSVIKNFMENATLNKDINLKTRIAKDLSFYGEENYELLSKFIDKFELEHKQFNYDKHFHSESEIVESGVIILNLMSLSIWLPMKTIELLTLKKIKAGKLKVHVPKRQVLDLTFRDLITWYIEGKFTPTDEISYRIKIKNTT